MTEAQQIRLDPDPLEPYLLSQGFRVGDLVIVSGQAALDEHGNIVGAGDFDAQAEQVFRNLERVLEAGGSSLERVVKVTIYLTDMANFGKIVELRRRWFTPPYPADTIVEVRGACASGARDRDRGDCDLVGLRLGVSPGTRVNHHTGKYREAPNKLGSVHR